jgi:histidine triad (HIT) family protein
MPHVQCLFCRIVGGELPATILAETEDAIALRDVNPQAPVHVLVIPKAHVRDLTEAASDPALLGRLLAFASQLARDEGIDERGYRVVINTKMDGGQSVYHLHLHLLGGRALGWPPG